MNANEQARSKVFTEPFGFTPGIEGPACDKDGNLYAVNYARQHTIGKVTPEGECSVFLELPDGSIGNGIRFDLSGYMYIADFVNHNVLKVDMNTKEITVHAHESQMNQPNDIAIALDGTIFASDPDWGTSTGNLWRVDVDGKVTLLEDNMGTTNGIEVSPDENTLYVNETAQRKVWAYDLTPEKEIRNKRLFHEFADYGLDGMRCDRAGNLYVTRFGKGTVAVLSPQGQLLQEIILHGKDCTNLAFGGVDGRTCYVTISDQGNVEMFRTDEPGRCWTMWQYAGRRG